jgi:vacuolar-type H+-ATPase subunit E/Vma4
MITVEDKIRTFSKYVYDKEVKQKEAALQQADAKFRAQQKEAESRILEKGESTATKQKKKLDMEAQRILSVAKLEARNWIHQIKGGIQKDLIAAMKEAVVQYTQTEEYIHWLKGQLDGILASTRETKAEVWLLSIDQQRLSDYIQANLSHATIIDLEEEALGGARIQLPTLGTRLDLTLESRLLEEENEMGVQLQELLDEAVSKYD